MFADFLYINGKCKKTELIMSILPPILLGILSFLLVINHKELYTAFLLTKLPLLASVFPVVWFAVLLLMGIASYRAKRVAPESISHVYFAAQLLTAFIWNVVLLRFGEAKTAFIVIIVYMFFLTGTFFEFDKCDKRAGRLIVPAMVWALVLSFLNYRLLR